MADTSHIHASWPALSHSLFLGPVLGSSAASSLYKLHLMYTEHRISRLQHHMVELATTAAGGNTNSPVKARAKRNSPQTDFEQTVLQSHGAILNSTTDPFYEYFDSEGNVYLDSCIVTKDNASKSAAFRRSHSLVHKYLSSQIGTDTSHMEYYGFRTVKPMSGLEYQFYLIHPDQINKRGYYHDRLYQVIFKHQYEQLHVQNKQIQKSEDITIVTIADDLSVLPELLKSLVQNCDSVQKANCKCGVLLLYDITLLGVEYTMADLAVIIDSVPHEHVQIQTFDISASSSLMNNFQRAVVSVHETLTENSLIVFLHPKSHINKHFLHRCQANAMAGKSAYFPIPFQLNPAASKTYTATMEDASRHPPLTSGFWKNTDFDSFCIHTADLQTLSILPESPQMLYRFLVSMKKTVRRLPDTGVTRLWDDGICNTHNTEQASAVELLKCQQDAMYQNL